MPRRRCGRGGAESGEEKKKEREREERQKRWEKGAKMSAAAEIGRGRGAEWEAEAVRNNKKKGKKSEFNCVFNPSRETSSVLTKKL